MKKVVCFLLVFIMVLSIGANQIFAAILDNDVTIVYIDGIKFKIYMEEENTIVETVGLSNNSKMILYENCKANLVLNGDNGNVKEFNLVINTLTEDNVDFSVSSSDGETKIYNDLKQLSEDEYAGQVAAVIGIGGVVSLSKFIFALIASCVTVYIAGCACWELEKALNKRKINKSSYYSATRLNHKVYIGINKISYKTAAARLKAGKDTYTWNKINARSIAKSAGRGVSLPEINKLNKKGVYYYHYHPRAGKNFHSFYGNAYVV